MKKKRILGIVTAMLMVIALALTGCGQQSGEQNAGATGSEGQNGTTAVDDGKNEGEVTTEPEDSTVVIGEMPDGSDPMELRAWYYKRDKAYIETVEKDTDGYYHYKVGDKELLCKTNVWDFIETKEGKRGTYYVWHFEDMVRVIGLYPDGVGFIHSAKTSSDAERNVFDMSLPVDATKNPYGQDVIESVGGSTMRSDKCDEAIYRLSTYSSWAIGLNQICFAAYELEQIQLGRKESEIMSSEFEAWKDNFTGAYIIP